MEYQTAIDVYTGRKRPNEIESIVEKELDEICQTADKIRLQLEKSREVKNEKLYHSVINNFEDIKKAHGLLNGFVYRCEAHLKGEFDDLELVSDS